MRTNLLAVLAVIVATWVAGCGRQVEPEPLPDEELDIPGILGGRCASGGFCNDGLLCSDDNVCVDDPAEGEGEGAEGEGEGEGEPACAVDADEDGSCSDVDCDDNDRLRFPGNNERCDYVDSNCDNRMNDDLDCTFLAHDRDTIFRIDPFAETSTLFREVTLISNASLLDIDSDVNGDLLAVTSAGLFRVESNGSLTAVVNAPAPPGTNGLAITGEGTKFLTNDDGADSAAFKIVDDALVEVGGFSAGFVSSGDCVVTKEEDLLMSAKLSTGTANDRLVQIDAATGATTDIGSIGFRRVFGLSASFGFLFGVTVEGQIIEIDRATGAGVLLFDTNVGFNGAANGD